MVEDFCGRVEIPDDADGDEWLSIPLNDAKVLANEITFVRSKKILHEIPMDTLTRLLHVIDRQIRCSQGLSIDVKENVSVVVAKFYLLQNCIWFSFFCSDLEIGSILDAALIVSHMLGCPQADAADAEPLVFSALESIHAALAIMTHHDMPKQLYREEVRTF